MGDLCPPCEGTTARVLARVLADRLGVRHVPTGRAPSDPLHVVLIDQDRTFTTTYKLMLESAGMEVLSAGDGRAGMELVSAVLPDVVVMDIALPDVDGLEVLAGLKSLDATRHIPVGILDVKANEGTMKVCHDLGAVGYLAKTLISPMRLAELLPTWAAASETSER
jgi:two-component system KDP operon response regulator KdpE